jgi:hypothetical protein
MWADLEMWKLVAEDLTLLDIRRSCRSTNLLGGGGGGRFELNNHSIVKDEPPPVHNELALKIAAEIA